MIMNYGTLSAVRGAKAAARTGHNKEKENEEEKCSENGSELFWRLDVIPKHRPSSFSRIGGVGLGIFLLLALVYFIACKTHDKNQGTSNVESFDYIVVGGGPSGIIAATNLARRLQHENVRVLLLESGTVSQSSVLSSVQSMSNRSSRSFKNANGVLWEEDVGGMDVLDVNKFDIPLMWSGVASRQGRISALGNALRSNHHWSIRRTLLARALGGCGVHNAMIYVRCLPTDMERWNLTGWTYDIMLSHYKKLETYVDSDWDQPSFFSANGNVRDKHWRGHDGPIRTVPAGPSIDPVAPLFIRSSIATEGVGLSKTRGFNDPSPEKRLGASYYEFNIRDGIRDSVAAALLGARNSDSPTLPDNLEIRTGATVLRLLSNIASVTTRGDKPRIVGVEYIDRRERVRQVMLTRAGDQDVDSSQVILAAGAIMTPQILVNSGIGPHGRVVHLPGVGENLQDHPVVAMSFRLAPNMTRKSSSMYTLGDEMEDYLISVAELKSPGLNHNTTTTNLTKSMRKLLHGRIGALGTPGFAAGAFLRSPWADDEAPDLQLTVFPRVVEPHVTGKERQDEVNFQRDNCMLVTVALLRPDARYTIYFDKPEDIQSASTSSNDAISAPTKSGGYETSTKSQIARPSDFHLPSIDIPVDSDEYLSDSDVSRLSWGMEQVRRIVQTAPLSLQTEEEVYPGEGQNLREYIRENHLPNSHWVGSTKMGTENDPMAVLDESLRVRGVIGLRVVDAGAIPAVPNGNTHSTVCVMADRAVDLIVAERETRQI